MTLHTEDEARQKQCEHAGNERTAAAENVDGCPLCLQSRIAELEAERDSIRDKALEEAAQLAKNAGYGAWLAEEIRALKGTKP